MKTTNVPKTYTYSSDYQRVKGMLLTCLMLVGSFVHGQLCRIWNSRSPLGDGLAIYITISGKNNEIFGQTTSFHLLLLRSWHLPLPVLHCLWAQFLPRPKTFNPKGKIKLHKNLNKSRTALNITCKSQVTKNQQKQPKKIFKNLYSSQFPCCRHGLQQCSSKAKWRRRIICRLASLSLSLLEA